MRICKLILIILSSSMMFGCANFYSESRPSQKAFLQNSSPAPEVSSRDIADDLTRSTSIENVRVKIIPETGALAHAKAREQVYLSKESPEQTQLQIKKANASIKDKLSFVVDLRNVDKPAYDVELKRWEFELSYDGHNYPLELVNPSEVRTEEIHTSVPVTIGGGYYIGNTYIPPTTIYMPKTEIINSSYGKLRLSNIDRSQVDLTKGFAIIVKPMIKSNVDTTKLAWFAKQEFAD